MSPLPSESPAVGTLYSIIVEFSLSSSFIVPPEFLSSFVYCPAISMPVP